VHIAVSFSPQALGTVFLPNYAQVGGLPASLPYHIGNGWFGGFLPPVAFALVALTGDTYCALRYPIIVALMTVVIGTLFLPETKDRSIN
jgi:hypothetical protein